MTRILSLPRGKLFGAVALVFLQGIATPAWALSESEAKGLIDSAVREINALVVADQSETKLYVNFENIFTKYADVATIARFGMGVEWRSSSKAQKRAFTESFKTYLSRKYAKQFRDFIGGEIEVKSTRRVKSFFEVKATANPPGEAPIDIIFLVSDRSGRTLFFNLFVEGVNMLLSERTEIGALLDKRGGNIDKLIADLGRLD